MCRFGSHTGEGCIKNGKYGYLSAAITRGWGKQTQAGQDMPHQALCFMEVFGLLRVGVPKGWRSRWLHVCMDRWVYSLLLLFLVDRIEYVRMRTRACVALGNLMFGPKKGDASKCLAW